MTNTTDERPSANEVPPLPPEPPESPSVPQPPLRRSPGWALVLSFLPGLGHVYLGLYSRAAAIFLAFLTAQVLADHADQLEIVAIFIWFFGLIDAYRMAQLLNAGGPEPEFPRPRRGEGRLGFGVFLVVVGLVLLINNFYPLDLSWLADWWPAILVAWGLYLLAGALRERRAARRPPWEIAAAEGGPEGEDT